MNTIRIHLASVLLTSLAIASPWTAPIGIPTPSWGALGNPIDLAVPAQPGAWPSSSASGYYYVDRGNPASTDTSNPYGYPNKPRKTIPFWSSGLPVPAGTYIEIHGSGYGTGQVRTTFAGTEERPCWVVGDWTISNEWIIKGSYVIFEGLKGDSTSILGMRLHQASNLHHCCVRGGEFSGPGTAAGNNSVFNVSGGVGNFFHDIVIYNVKIHGYGDDDPNCPENDFHGLCPNLCNDVWIVDCEIYNMGGDSVQVGSASTPVSDYSYNIYIGRNRFYSNRENAVDVKRCKKVIISQNVCHGYPHAGTDGGAAIVIHDGSDQIWTIFNEIYNSENGIAVTAGTNIWSIGNRIRQIAHTTGYDWSPRSMIGAAIHYRGAEGGVVGNTIWGCESGTQFISAGPYVHQGNIYAGRMQATGYDLDIDNGTVSSGMTSDYNLYQSPSFYLAGSKYTSLTAFQTSQLQDAHSLQNPNPGLVNPPGDLSIIITSPAKDASAESSCYGLFLTTFGIDIKRDSSGGKRPVNGVWDIGAFEFGADGNPGSKPAKPTDVKVDFPK